MTKKGEECPYYHRNCPSGCQKVDCRASFPKEVKVIMESQKSICLSAEYHDCQRFIDGNKYRADKELNRVGCTFLHEKICGKPGAVYCGGHVPPFEIKKDNNLQSCYGNDFKDCPNYVMGVAFAEEANRKRQAVKP